MYDSLNDKKGNKWEKRYMMCSSTYRTYSFLIRKTLIIFVLAFLFTTPLVTSAASGLKLYYDKKNITYTGQQVDYIMNETKLNKKTYPGIIISGISLAPAKDVFTNKGIGASYSYTKAQKKVTIKKGDTSIIMTLGSKKAYVNGKAYTMPLAARAITYKSTNVKKIYVPARFVMEHLGYEYTWYNKESKVIVKDKGFSIYYDNATYSYRDLLFDMVIQGETIESEMPGILIDSTILLPAEEMFSDSFFDIDYKYNKKTETAIFWNEDTTVEFVMGSNAVYVNSEEIGMGATPYLVKNIGNNKSYVMIPGDILALYFELQYEQDGTTIYINELEEIPEDDIEDEEYPEDEDTEDDSQEDIPPTVVPEDPDDDIEIEQPSIPDNMNYSVKIKRPIEIGKGQYTIVDDYLNRQFIITIPGNYISYYQSNLPEKAGNVICDVTTSYHVSGSTSIYIKTDTVKAFVIEEDKDAIYIKIKSPKEVYPKVVVIDAGHGGTDTGTIGYGLKERDLNLKILQYAKTFLDQCPDIKVYYTRLNGTEPTITAGSVQVPTTDASLKARYNFTNEILPDMFISIHVNSATNVTARGTELLYAKTNQWVNNGGLNSKGLADIGLKYLLEAVGSKSRGIKDRSDLPVLYRAKVPAILMETAFLSNSEDAAILQSEDALSSMGEAIYKTILEAYANYPVY